jgi:hypothetical protein
LPPPETGVAELLAGAQALKRIPVRTTNARKNLIAFMLTSFWIDLISFVVFLQKKVTGEYQYKRRLMKEKGCEKHSLFWL